MHQTAVVEAAERIYSELLALKIDVLLDDRDVRPGVKFKDADLLGTPLRITLSEKNLKEGKAELKVRSEREASYIPLDQAPAIIMETIKEHYDSIK
jgi:prolyl-tRNA synthetase